MSDESILPGDVVQVNGQYGRREGLVIGSHYDYLGRQVVEVQLDPGEIITTPYTTVTRIKRTVSYQRPAKIRSVERQIYW